mgnify:CR=1 FL=1
MERCRAGRYGEVVCRVRPHVELFHTEVNRPRACLYGSRQTLPASPTGAIISNSLTCMFHYSLKEEFDFESIKNKAIEQLKAGKPLLGKDGAFAPLLENILNAALEGEMDAYLTEEERQMGNRRNGKMQK